MASEPTVQELRDLVAEFQPDRGHVLPALHKVQETYGYISRPASGMRTSTSSVLQNAQRSPALAT